MKSLRRLSPGSTMPAAKARSAWASTSCMTGNVQASPRTMPTACAPWPGNRKPSLHVAVPIGAGLGAAVLLQHAMEVRAAEAERAHARPPRVAVARQPRLALGVDVERRPPGSQRVERRLHLDRRRQDLVVQRQRRLD